MSPTLSPRERYCVGFITARKHHSLHKPYIMIEDDVFYREGYNDGWYCDYHDHDEVGIMHWEARSYASCRN